MANRSVLREWVTELNFRGQGSLLVALRGCDEAPKLPLDSAERQLTAFIRWCVMHPADAREVNHPGGFMRDTPPDEFRISAVEHYPHHWVMKVLHALRIISIYHDQDGVRLDATRVYLAMVEGMHLSPETPEHLEERVVEDRIATGRVVW